MNNKRIMLLAVALLSFLTASCTNLWHDMLGDNVRKGVSSSLVDYLYPEGEVPPANDQNVPNLQLPLRVGLAFVPSYSNNVEGLSEANKSILLEKVKASFSKRDYISEITVIPDTYLRSRKGFKTVDQVSRLYGLDVIALVSYDQVAHVDDTKSSILYWTVVGAYLVKGSTNDVQTFVDTAIFDVKTHKLLFRAPGINKVEGSSTLVNSPEHVRKAREESFSLAMADMTTNLESELEVFKERIKTDKSVTVTHRDGYGGGGSFDIALILLMLGFFVIRSFAFFMEK